MTTRVKSYRINTDENVRKWDAIVIWDDWEMTWQHLGTAASLDNWTCPGNVPILDSNWKLPDSLTPTSVMKKCVYDPHPELHEQWNDVFDYDNFYNTPTIPEVYDPTITFIQGWVNRGSISLNQASWWTIELMAGWLDAGVATWINNNAIDVNVDETSVNVNSNNKLCVVDYDTIKSWAAAWATAVQENDLATVAMTGNYCDLINKPEIPSAQIQSDWAQTNVNLADYIKNKPTIGNATITLQKNGSNVDTFELNQTADKCINLVLSKWDVGLGNVDNTSDADKPVSDATLCALACKQDNISDLNTIRSNACAGKTASETIANYWDIVSHNSCEYATATQGWKADTAVQPWDLCAIATSWAYCDLSWTPVLCDVATTGCYNDLSWKPNLSVVATSGKYCDLSWTPELCTVATTGCYADLSWKPNLCTVATTGKYCDLTGTPLLCAIATSAKYCDLLWAPSLSTVATSGKYCDLSWLPTIPTDNCQLANSCWYTTCIGNVVTSDLSAYAKCNDLSTVATSWNYCDLNWKPTIPTDNSQLANGCWYTTCIGNVVTSDLEPYAKSCNLCTVASSGKYCDLTWTPLLCNIATTAQYSDLIWAPTLCTVATSWKYCDLSWLPTIPTDNCELSNSCGYTTCIGTVVASDLEPYAKSCDLKTVATSGKYCDLTGTPTIPTDNCQLSNGCGYTTCTWTLVASDLNPYAKSCDLKTVATTWKYCDLTGKPTIPTDNCQLANSCWYITNAVNNLTNYYLKCETYQKCEVDNLIANFGWFEVVATLPSTNIKTNVIYLLWPIWTGSDKYEEWIYYNNTWTKIWETTTDLSNYAKCCDIPTNNNQLTNGCGYTTCTGTLVASDLNPYAKSCTLCTVATSGKYCDLTGKPTIPTDNCQLANSCGYTTCTGTLVANDIANLAQCCDIPTDNCQLANSCWYTTCTWTLVASDLNPYAKSCTLCTVATSGKYCDLTGKPTIPTNNNQLANGCWYTTCTWTVVASDLQPYTKSCDLCAVAKSWKYCDLTGAPTIPTDNCQLDNWCWYTTCTWTLVSWDLAPYAKSCDLCNVATTGLYCDLSWKPDLSWYALSCNMVCSLDWADNSHYPTTLAVANALGSAGYWDMLKATYDPCNCAKDAFNYNNLYNKPTLCTVATSGKYCDLTGTPTIPAALSAWENIEITNNVVSANNYYIIHEWDTCTTYTWEVWVAPYNTNYCYTNICINPDSWIKWVEGATYSFVIDKGMIATSACRNVRVKIGNGDYIPVMGSSAILWWHSYFTKANQRQYTYSTKYESGWALHLFTDNNTTYSAMSVAEFKANTCTCARSVTSKCMNAILNCYKTDNFCKVATSWKYCDLTWTPTIPTNNNQLTNGCGYTTCTWTLVASDLNPYAKSCTLCAVATSWKYCDLSWTPSLATVATTGCYNDLTGKPTIPTKVSQLSNDCNYIDKDVTNLSCYTPTSSLATVATSGAYCDLSGTPSLACVACSWCYDDLTGKPNLWVYQRTCNMVCTLTGADDSHYPTAKTVADALSACGAGDMLKSTYDPNNKNGDAFDYTNFINTPKLCTVATSGKYCDLTGTPTIPSELTSGCATSISSNKINVNYDWTTIKKNSWNCLYVDFTWYACSCDVIKCKSTTWSQTVCTTASWCTTAFWVKSNATSSYISFSNCTGWLASIWATSDKNPTWYNGTWHTLAYTEDIPTDNCQLANGCGYTTCTGTLVTSDLTPYAKSNTLCAVATSWKYCDLTGTPSLATVATSGCYCDLTWTPTIPTVNTKTFTLGSTSDTTNASAAAAYINDWNNAIILLSWQTYYLTSKWSSSMVFKSSVTSTWWTSDTELKQSTLTFTVSGNTVTAISNTGTSLGKYLQTDKNYWTAYTPLYNGSPATKKYVDDCVWAINSAEWWNITGTMSCQTDLTNALACKAQCCDIPTNNNQLTNWCWYTTCTGTLVASDLTPYACSCDVLTKTNTNSYSPTADYNPATKKYVDDAVAWAGGWDMCYADFSPVSKSWASITLDLYSTLTPSANFTVNKPSTVKAWQTYVLRITSWATAYTMTLGTWVTNPFGTDLVLTPNWVDQFVFYATSSSTLELQKDYDDENIFVTQDEYENLPSTKLTDNKTYFIYEE